MTVLTYREKAMAQAMTIQALSQKLEDHLENCAASNVATAKALTELTAAVTEIKTLPMRAVKWVAGIVGTAVITLAVQNYALHQETAHKADAAAQRADAAATAVSDIPAATAKAVASEIKAR